MGAVKGKWTERVECVSNAEAQVKRDEFRRKGMISRIRRIPVRYQSGKAIGGVWAVQARTPKKGPNTYRYSDATPLILVDWPVVISKTTKTQTGRDFRGKPTYQENETKSAGVQVKAMRLKKDKVAEAIADEQEKVNRELGIVKEESV